MVRVALTFSFLVLAVLAPAAQAASQTRIILRREAGLTGAERADIRRDADVTHVRTLAALPNTELVTTDDPKAALAALRADSDVRYAEIDRVRHAFTNDADWTTQWGLENSGHNLHDNFAFSDGSRPAFGVADADMDVPDAWALGAIGAGVTVAVVDSGVQASHPDLAAQINTTLSRGFHSGANPGYADGNGHGTHVSGIIGAVKENSTGIAGIAPGVSLVELKALDDSGNAPDSDIIAAFDYAGDHGIPVVNASLGGEGRSDALTDSMASHPNTLYVIAAGNDGYDNDTHDIWPCNAPAPNVLCVGASTQDDASADFSDYGRQTVDVFAPGEYIWSTWPGSGYELESGTSMASPAVAAEAALVRGAAPALTPTQIKATILASGDPKPAFTGRSVSERRANAQQAVALAKAGTIPADRDADGVPDSFDTPVDSDGDGVADPVDACPTVAAATANGCPKATTTPPPPTTTTTNPASPVAPAPPIDSDADGRPDASDLCPTEFAGTTTGCPVPALKSVVVKPSRAKHRATIKVRTTRAATVALTVERRVCNKQGRKCKWRKAASQLRSTKHNRVTFTVRKLGRGKYRVGVRLSSPAGRARLVRTLFSV